MRSWLSSPWVTLIGFVASVIAIVQLVFSFSRNVHRAMRVDRSRWVVRIWVTVASLVVVVITSVFSWPVIVDGVEKTGTHGLLAVSYPIMLNGLAAAGALLLFIEAVDGHKFPFLYCGLTVGALALAAVLYVGYRGWSDWKTYVVVGGPVIVVIMLLLAMLGPATVLQHRETQVDAD